MIAHSWQNLTKKLIGGLLILGLLYWLVERQSPDSTVYDDEVVMIQLAILAAIVGTTMLFLVNMLFVAPYQLWKEQADQLYPDREFDEAFHERAKISAEKIEDEERLKLRASIKAKAEAMHSRLYTRNISMPGMPDDYMARMWDDEQNGIPLDGYGERVSDAERQQQAREDFAKEILEEERQRNEKK